MVKQKVVNNIVNVAYYKAVRNDCTLYISDHVFVEYANGIHIGVALIETGIKIVVSATSSITGGEYVESVDFVPQGHENIEDCSVESNTVLIKLKSKPELNE